MIRTSSAGAVAATLAAALVAGCSSGHAAGSPQPSAAPSIATYNGVESLQSNDILVRARAALKQAKSYHVNGEYVDGDRKTTVDFTVVGKDFDGSIVFGGSKMAVLSTGGEHYVRPYEKSWTAPSGKWLKVSAGAKDFADLFSTFDVDAMLAFDGPLTKGGPSTVDGVSTIAVLENGDPIETVYVARIGEPYPVRLAGADGYTLRLTGFNDPSAHIEKPAPDQVRVVRN